MPKLAFNFYEMDPWTNSVSVLLLGPQNVNVTPVLTRMCINAVATSTLQPFAPPTKLKQNCARNNFFGETKNCVLQSGVKIIFCLGLYVVDAV